MPHEAALLSAEDFVASFCLLSQLSLWHRWFTFLTPVRARDVGIDQDGDVYLAAVVLPMGFSRVTGFMLAWHRQLAFHPPHILRMVDARLPAALVVRGDRAFPLSVSEGSRAAWPIYIDDFCSSARQLALRESIVGSYQRTLRLS